MILHRSKTFSRAQHNPGDLVLVGYGNGMTITGRVVERANRAIADRGDVWWVDVNMLGTHLPQMFRQSELTPMSQAQIVRYSLCRLCSGFGREEDVSCSGCGGSGRCDLRVRTKQEAVDG